MNLSITKSNTSNLPLITIITVVYNGALYLEDTIKSVLKQNYKNIKYFIIDGGSTDNTVKIIKKYDQFIDYWSSEPDEGIYDAMNKGWQQARSDSFILYLGAGDKIITLPTEDEIIANIDNVIYGDVKLKHKDFISEIGYRLKLSNTLHHQALLVPKKTHIKNPFDINFKTYADYDFNLRLYLQGVGFYKSKSLIGYAAPDGVSAQINVNEMAAVSKKNNGYFWAFFSYIYCFYQYIKIKRNKENKLEKN